MAVLNCDFLIHMQENFTKMKELFKKKKAITKSQIEINIEEGINLADNMVSKIMQKLENVEKSKNDYFRLLGMKATLLYEQSKQYVMIGQQEKAEDILQKSYTEFKENILRPELGYVILRILNHLAFYVHTTVPVRAQQYLEESETHYYQMVLTNPSFSWCTSNELFSSLMKVNFQFSTREKFEKLFVNNLQLLSCIYFQQNNIEKYVLYQHNVLTKQLTISDTDPTHWASKVSRLAIILLQLEMFKDARHHLAAATCVMEAHSANLASFLPSPNLISKETETQRTFAEVSRCWVKYGINLLTASKYRLFRQKYGESNDFLNSLWTTPKEIFEIVETSQDTRKTNEEKCVGSMNILEEINNPDNIEVSNCNESSNGKIKSSNDIAVIQEECDVIDENIKESIEAMKESIDNLREVRSNTAVSVNKVNEAMKESIDNLSIDRSDTTITGEKVINFTEHPKLVKNSNADPTTNVLNTENPEVDSFSLPEKNLIFTMIETSVFEKKVTNKFVTTPNQAYDLFLFTHFWVKKSKDFYRFHIHPEEYINAVLDLSELYRLLGFFNDNIEVQYKVQKRRSDTLEALHVLIKELNPDVYMNVSIDLLRELAEVQIEMIRLNIHRMNSAGKETDLLFNKIGAMTDIRSRLNCYRESLGHSVLFGSIHDKTF